ncbi:uncharacterized protein JN550_008978 [Neoarthrinium moseri]|uniref:uncharacterized protein n=1 Tax=Neoarthrinium moseri TaxID=1658444 RepID=UPI001FDB0ADB|nr:uncharacterized protein JN550_008978 [Neoarthrinium moseri]KAI1864421.1 hypothetical protein JN550_008978 [Neoarthrinium moseri]
MATNGKDGWALLEAINKTDLSTLRSLLNSMCQSSEECYNEAAKRLLVPVTNRKRAAEQEPDDSTKRQKTVVSRYEKCITCKEVFDITGNGDDACKAHEGDLVVDPEHFPDDDDIMGYSGIEVDPYTDWRREEWPDGFYWTCCDERLHGKFCIVQKHIPDTRSALAQITSDQTPGSNSMRAYCLVLITLIAVGVSAQPTEDSTVNALKGPVSGPDDDLGGSSGSAPHEPLIYPDPSSIDKRGLDPRFDIGGVSIDLDSLSTQVYDKVKGEVGEAIDSAREGLNEAIDAARKGLEEARDAAKKVLDDIKNAVEEVWEKIKAKVAELENQIMTAVHDWVWEYILWPLIKLLIIILVPFVLLFLWWALHLVAKPFVRELEISFEMQDIRDGAAADKGELPPRPRASSRGWAYYAVRSWERYGQGLICFACPWIGNWILWKSRNKMSKEVEKLRAEVNFLMKRQAQREVQARQKPIVGAAGAYL